jgi:hemoglobin
MEEAADISSRNDIVQILEKFYSRAFEDDLIGHFFTVVVPLDLEKHIPVITDFWESVIFGTGNYRKNVMEVHRHIHLLSSIEKKHLDRWVHLFSSTIDNNFRGDKSELMKQRAFSIATLMNIKLNHDDNKGSTTAG